MYKNRITSKLINLKKKILDGFMAKKSMKLLTNVMHPVPASSVYSKIVRFTYSDRDDTSLKCTRYLMNLYSKKNLRVHHSLDC